MSTPAARTVPLLIAAMLAAGILVLAGLLAKDSRKLSQLETDRATLHDISYGALDSDQWVARLSPILAKRIERFEISEENRPHLKALLTRVIDRLIEELPSVLIRMEGGGGSMVSRLLDNTSDRAIRLMLDASGIKDKSPELADALIDELEKPETKKELVALMHGALTEAAAENLPPTDRTKLKQVHNRHQCGSTPECEARIDAAVAPLESRTNLMLAGLLALAVLLLLLAWKTFGRAPGGMATMLIIGAGGLLAAGILAPMIQIDARVSELDFDLLGDSIRFENQVLYFQSKSILDVVEVLIRDGQADLVLVGGLIALFSIGFPVAKLLTSGFMVLRGRNRPAGPVTRFFGFHSSKWAMADVFVVALFMAYIGMRGMVSDQLAGLQSTGSVSVLTTNGTALEPGFWAFLMFALFGIAMGALLQRWKTSGDMP